ncbi:hypothetical protein IQ274_25010 [Nostoc sp. LEGE 12447]|uniref:hypothetical protein n=1 Tax=Nostoc sp. LEGE 12447 TaxID=1828640 RepID=UPI0018832AB8|nr:hypothetical protein [Nostoc sp. LEGE 12447]MBE9001387.1 hypothetical protein [Nostoc sp. LEGE 12447]
MSTISQIRGMLLEEALLHLLKISGYITVEKASTDDPTLRNGHSGLEVLGRGGQHQIDAVADFAIAHPFSHPQRLLIEAKCYSDDKTCVGIEVIRNAVGVLKDVEEHWFSINGVLIKKRYHYQYAVFSATGYTDPAERYAFAQDIYLIPLAKSRFIQPIIQSIRKVTYEAFGARDGRNNIEVNMTELRNAIRVCIKNQNYEYINQAVENLDAGNLLKQFCQECHRVKGGVVAMIGRQFPLFLVPNPDISIHDLQEQYTVRIIWDNEGWYLRYNGINIFSFDLPIELFELYAEGGILSPTRALDLKNDFMSQIQAIVTLDGQTRIITLDLDREWLNSIRNTYR